LIFIVVVERSDVAEELLRIEEEAVTVDSDLFAGEMKFHGRFFP